MSVKCPRPEPTDRQEVGVVRRTQRHHERTDRLKTEGLKLRQRFGRSSCQQVLDVVSAAWRVDCARLEHRRQTAGHMTGSATV